MVLSGSSAPAIVAARKVKRRRTICAPTALPDSARRWQAMFDAIHHGSWSGGDGAHSVLLPDGRVLVMFGDTFGGALTPTGARRRDPAFFPNSMAIAGRGAITWVNEPDRPAIPAAPDGTVHWPEAAAATSSQVHVFTNRVRRCGTAVAGIRVIGQSMATFDLDPFTLRTITPLTTFGPEPTGCEIWWCAGAIAFASELYVYGSRLERLGEYGRSIYVARAPLHAPADRSLWRYWDGATWTRDDELPLSAGLIRNEADTVVSVWRSGANWSLVTQKYGALGRDISLWTALRPQGPWRESKVLHTIAPCEHPDAMFYESTAHPEVPLASGKLLLSYSRNGSNARIHADGNWYKPQFVEASLGRRV